MTSSSPTKVSKSFSFGPQARLQKRWEILLVQNKGQKLFAKHFVILVLRTNRSQSRLGVTITTKVARRANVRNRLRRQLRELFRLNRARLVQSFDILVIARNNAPECAYADVEREVIGSFLRARLLKDE